MTTKSTTVRLKGVEQTNLTVNINQKPEIQRWKLKNKEKRKHGAARAQSLEDKYSLDPRPQSTPKTAPSK